MRHHYFGEPIPLPTAADPALLSGPAALPPAAPLVVAALLGGAAAPGVLAEPLPLPAPAAAGTIDPLASANTTVNMRSSA